MKMIIIRAFALLALAAGPASAAIKPAPNAVVTDIVSTTDVRLFDDVAGVSSGSRFERIAATVTRGGFRFRGGAHDILLRGIVLDLASPRESPNLPAGMEIVDAHDIVVEDSLARRFQMVVVPGSYTNGDGFSTERAASRITFRRVSAIDNSDGGFDLKSTDTLLDWTYAARNYRNYRLWGSGTATTITSEDPRGAHIGLVSTANWHIARLIVRSTTTAPIIDADGGTLIIDACDIKVPAGTLFIHGRGTITLGATCKL